jgi:hypothetical protein
MAIIHMSHQADAHAPNIIADICHTGRWSFQNSTSGITSAIRLGSTNAVPSNSAYWFLLRPIDLAEDQRLFSRYSSPWSAVKKPADNIVNFPRSIPGPNSRGQHEPNRVLSCEDLQTRDFAHLPVKLGEPRTCVVGRTRFPSPCVRSPSGGSSARLTLPPRCRRRGDRRCRGP